MDKEQIFAVIKQNIIDVVPELEKRNISITDSLKELGANSVDRAEILVKSMADLKLQVPLIDFGLAKNLEELVAIFQQKLQAQNQ